MVSKDVNAFTPQITACSFRNNVSTVTDVSVCKMFPHLCHLANASLTILHGNAAAECGFAVNTALLSKVRISLDEAMIRLVKKTFHCMNDGSAAVLMTQSVISVVCHAHPKYTVCLKKTRPLKQVGITSSK